MSGILRGSKFSSKHQTFIDKALPLLKFGRDTDVVKKVVLGEIKPVKSRGNEIIAENTPTSIKITVKSPNQVQILFFIGSQLEIMNELKNNFDVRIK